MSTDFSIVAPPPAPGFRRQYIYNPCTIAECGGPCVEGGPEACICGALWADTPVNDTPVNDTPTIARRVAVRAWSRVLDSLDERIAELQRQRCAHLAQREDWIRLAIGESGAPPDPA